MADLRVSLVLNEGRHGVPLDRLAEIAEQCEKFLRMLAEDTGIEIERGQWVAQNFREGSVVFDAVHAADHEPPKVIEFARAFSYVTSFDPDKQRPNGVVRTETLRQYARIADPLTLDDQVKIGIYAPTYVEPTIHGAEPVQQIVLAPEPTWAYLAKPVAVKIAHRLDEMVDYQGSVAGTIHALFKGDDMHFKLRDQITDALVNCYFDDSMYHVVVEALEQRNAIVYAYGAVRARRADRRIESIRVARVMVAPALGDDEYRRFFGSAPGYGGNIGAADLIRSGFDRDSDA